MESYNKREFAANGIPFDFVQDNHSVSKKGVLRGLHYQCKPREQGKLLRVMRGSIFDVVVDLRPESPTYGKWLSEELSSGNKKIIYIPAGFAHGYCTLESGTEILYKTTDFYSPEHERGIAWDDPDLKIAWPSLGKPFIVSDRDKKHPSFKSLRAAVGRQA